MEKVVRQRKNKAVNRGRRDKRGTSEIAEEAGGFHQDVEVRDTSVVSDEEEEAANQAMTKEERDDRWKRILLLIVAVTVHNIPEGLAVGVAFGSVGKAPSATFDSARNLAIGIGIRE